MIERNADIKAAARSAGVKLWRIAEILGINDSNFSRLLRKNLPDSRKQEILAIIDTLKQEDEQYD